jgi:hypothetical protein
MPAAALYVLNPAGFAAFQRSPMIEEMLLRTAEKIESHGVAISPVRTGEYVASWYSETGRRGNGLPYGRAGNRAPHASYLEWGTRYMRRQRILGRALDAATTNP